MYIMRCDKCGWWEERDSVLITKCPNCNSPLIIDLEADEDINPTELGEEDSHLIKIRNEIKAKGSKKIWGFIEEIENPRIRINFRKLFFKAGGKMPERSK